MRVPAVAVKGDDPFEVVFELVAIEEALLAKEELRAGFRGEGAFQRAFVDVLDALEVNRVDANHPGLSARRRGRDKGHGTHKRKSTAEHHPRRGSKDVPGLAVQLDD